MRHARYMHSVCNLEGVYVYDDQVATTFIDHFMSIIGTLDEPVVPGLSDSLFTRQFLMEQSNHMIKILCLALATIKPRARMDFPQKISRPHRILLDQMFSWLSIIFSYRDVDPALLRPDEMIMILYLYLVNSNQDQDQETNESVLQSTDPIH
ncbi:LOW QUALITY PROTEIN: hypothetical protein OSB04_024568 [Centaurea solstitialis]|uniref:Uncharacterized protein n=1 Tax=Centaurea solstitialis TaxID=347529 RepID=A0AA38SZQ9_9ASTR|nr:LOW QUALITY PROTEIN: hypothetical protein OSB04_024568 [Centaurea solstitialis]